MEKLSCQLEQSLNQFSFLKNGDALLHSFAGIADLLMNHTILMAGAYSFRVVECEFYYFNPGSHEDPFCHKRDEQLKMCAWYFNDFGLDLAFGNGNVHASILIRGIRGIRQDETDLYTSGSSKVVRCLFTSMGSAFSNNGGIWLRNANNGELNLSKIFSTARVNLAKEKDTNDFFDKPYRFLAELNPGHKFAHKEQVLHSLIAQGVLTPEMDIEVLGYRLKG